MATTTNAPEQTLYRSFELDRAAVNEQARTVALSFSSEAPVDRRFGSEILDHSPKSVRLGRLNNGAALLLNHDPDDQIGVVESATIGPDKRGRAIVRFGKGKEAEEVFQDVMDGIRRLVSVGYRIHKQVTTNEPDGVVSVRVTDWEPYELSLVSVPADDSVGVGRSGINPTKPQTQSNDTMSENATPPPAATVHPEATRSAPVQVTGEAPQQADPAEAVNRGIVAERARIAAITATAAQARSQGITVDEARAIGEGATPDQFRNEVLEALLKRSVNYQPSAPSKQEARDLGKFSLVRAIGKLLSQQPLDGIERELDQEARREGKEIGVGYSGQLAIPQAWMRFDGRRDMTATIDTTHGAAAIATTLGPFIDLLYNKVVFRDLGAQFLTGLVGNLDLPRLATGTTPALTATEVTAATESSPTMDKVSLTPNRLATYVEVTKRLMLQSDISIENMLRNDMARAMAVIMETAAIHGTGTNEGLGICAVSGIGDVAGGTNGAAPTWAHIVALETAVAADNADLGSLAYLTNTAVRGKLKTTAKVSSTDSVMVWDRGPNPLNEYRTAVTNSVSSTLTKGGSGAVASAIIFGNFADLIIAQWGGIDISVNPYSLDKEGMVRINVESYYDSNVRRPVSFAAMLDALTA